MSDCTCEHCESPEHSPYEPGGPLNPGTRLPILTDYDTCTECGGACCKTLPGEVWPADVWADSGPDWTRIKEMIRSGRYSIDWWEAEVPSYFLRPATKGSEGLVFQGAWTGECTFLTGTGCPLTESDRPTSCRVLVPSPPNCHTTHGGHGKEAAKNAWLPWSAKLERIGREIDEPHT